MALGDLFHRHSRKSSSDKSRKHQKSLSQSEARLSTDSIPYEATSPSRAPVIGSSPLQGNDHAVQRQRQPSSSAAAAAATAAAIHGNRPKNDTARLEDGMQELNLQDTSSRHASRQAVPPQATSQPLFHLRAPYSDVAPETSIAPDAQANPEREAPAPVQLERKSNPAQNGSASSTQESTSTAYESAPSSSTHRAGRPHSSSISRKQLDTNAQVASTSANLAREAQSPKNEKHLDIQQPHVIRRRSSREDLSGNTVHQDKEGLRQTNAAPIQEMNVADAETKRSLQGIVDLNNTTDTTIHERWAPAVTHETVHKHHHNIREEVITRHIHTHDVYHRIQPIIDVQVLPTRHFIPHPDKPGEKIEIPEDHVAARSGAKTDWVIAETVTKLDPFTTNPPKEPLRFSARRFDGEDGDTRQWIEEDGTRKSERTWVHPPELETGGQLTGQTVPFHFGHEREEMNGIRPDLS